MNIYTQDKTIPILITLYYEGNVLTFPINPENIRKEIGSSSITEEIEGIGQISVPKTPDLAKITIESFFWKSEDYIPSSAYVIWLERWQKSKKPANLVVTRLNYSMKVTCESFHHWINAGEEEDVYFSLELQEYRPHSAKKLVPISNNELLNKIKNTYESLSEYAPIQLFSIPARTRIGIIKKTFYNPYTVKTKNETLLTITKKITGSTDDWKSLYDENKETLADIIEEESVNIPEETKLKLPDEWVNNKEYNIVQEIL